jgi:hypothetical protein
MSYPYFAWRRAGCKAILADGGILTHSKPLFAFTARSVSSFLYQSWNYVTSTKMDSCGRPWLAAERFAAFVERNVNDPVAVPFRALSIGHAMAAGRDAHRRLRA